MIEYCIPTVARSNFSSFTLAWVLEFFFFLFEGTKQKIFLFVDISVKQEEHCKIVVHLVFWINNTTIYKGENFTISPLFFKIEISLSPLFWILPSISQISYCYLHCTLDCYTNCLAFYLTSLCLPGFGISISRFTCLGAM